MNSTTKLIEILKQEYRTQEDISFLKAHLQNNKFFASIFESFKTSPDIISDICKSVKYEIYSKFSLIFKQYDENCDKVFIIIKGRALILMINPLAVFSQDSEESQTLIPQTKYSKDMINYMLVSQEDDQMKNDIPESDFMTVLNEQYGKLVLEIGEGSLFGEKALIDNKPRAATICSKTHCECLILLKKDFQIIQSRYNKQQAEKKEFIMQQFPFLGTLISSAKVFERVIRFFEEESYNKNYQLCQENITINNVENQKVYIIVHGEIHLFKSNKEINLEDKTHLWKKEQLHIATLGPKEIIGEELLKEEEGEEKRYWYSSVVASSTCKLLSATAWALKRELPDKIKQNMIECFKEKLKLRGKICDNYNKQIQDISERNQVNSNQQVEFQKQIIKKVQLINLDRINKLHSNKSSKNTIQTDQYLQKIEGTSLQENQPRQLKNGSNREDHNNQHHDECSYESVNKKNPFPFKILKSHRYFKQLEDQLRNKNYQYANLNSVLHQHFQKLEDISIHSQQNLRDEVPSSTPSHLMSNRLKDKLNIFQKGKHSNHEIQDQILQTKENKFVDNQKQSNVISFKSSHSSSPLKNTSIQLKIKQTIEANDQQTHSSKIHPFISKNSITPLENQVKIKLNGVLSRIANKYVPHGEYYEEGFNAAESFLKSKQNADLYFKYLKSSRTEKNITESRKILSKSPMIRRINALEEAINKGGDASIPSNMRNILDGSSNINSKYHFYSSQKKALEKKQDQNYHNLKQVKAHNLFLIENSFQKLSSTSPNKGRCPSPWTQSNSPNELNTQNSFYLHKSQKNCKSNRNGSLMINNNEDDRQIDSTIHKDCSRKIIFYKPINRSFNGVEEVNNNISQKIDIKRESNQKITITENQRQNSLIKSNVLPALSKQIEEMQINDLSDMQNFRNQISNSSGEKSLDILSKQQIRSSLKLGNQYMGNNIQNQVKQMDDSKESLMYGQNQNQTQIQCSSQDQEKIENDTLIQQPCSLTNIQIPSTRDAMEVLQSQILLFQANSKKSIKSLQKIKNDEQDLSFDNNHQELSLGRNSLLFQ